ncbi:MAG: LysM peptidoglycan-binding domain-containing protein [Pseudomonadales bacterium]
MKYVIQFSIILTLIVLAGCQVIERTGSLDEPAIVADPIASSLPHLDDDVQIAAADMEEASAETAIDLDEPVDVALEVGPDPDLWQRIRDGFQLDHHMEEARVRSEFNWYARHPEYLDRVATRASRHLYHIVEAIEARGLPMEFALLPIVESAFDPFAYSHGRASGLWQFIPATGRRYGLKIDYWYDGRRDVPAATTAALDYLETLYKMLGQDWLLALAAYNSGEGNVRYSIRKNEKAGKPTDFWSLGLLAETRAYVPRLLAISALISDPAKYDIQLKSIPNLPYWTPVDIGSQLDLARATQLSDISTEELYLLNPAFNKWSTPPEGPHRLLVPVAKAESFKEAIENLPVSARLTWRRHPVKSGESLSVIAARYNTSIDTIRNANNIRGNVIRAGEALLVPVASQDQAAYELSEEGRLQKTRAHAEKRAGTKPLTYTIRPGDNFWDLSRHFNVSMRDLARWNGMATTDLLIPGKDLKIFTDKPVEIAVAPSHNEVIRKVNYRVRNGESLSLIAAKFNVPLSSIIKWNQDVTGRKYLQPGDLLTLFVDVTAQD